MLEEIALSISTALFFVCAFFVNGLVPQTPAEQAIPCEIVESETFAEASLVGRWNSGGKIFEFTKSGKLIFEENLLTYKIDGNTITVNAQISGFTERSRKGGKRIYTMKYELLSDRVIKLNGVTMYRVE